MTMHEIDAAGAGESTCRLVLARYAPGIVPLSVESLGAHNGFSGAKIWRVVTPQGDFALRQWPAIRGLPQTRILGLHRLLEHLRNEGLTFVAVPLATYEGTTLLSDFASVWQLEPWMPGAADFHSHPSQTRLRAAMAALAQWHLAASRFVPSDDESQWFSSHSAAESPTVAERLAILDGAAEGQMYRVRKWISSERNPCICDLATQILELFQRGRGQIIAELLLVRDVTVRLQPVLRDVWHDHLLLTGDEVTGLIDPAACRTESVACDLSRLIGSLVGDDSAATEFAFEEYQKIRELSTGERALAVVFDRSGVLLSGWTWLEWLYLERRPFPAPDPVIKRLTQILERLRRLVDVDSHPSGGLILP